MWTKVGIFLVSAAIHAVIVFGALREASRVEASNRWVVLAVGLVLVAGIAAAKGARYGRQAQDAYLAGAVAIGISGTVFVLWLSWALSHPVGEPPPLGSYAMELLQLRGGAVWMVTPTLAIALAAVVGAEIGRLFKGTQAG